MPAQPPVREPEEEMEAGKESQLPDANGELEQVRDDERGGEETMEESMEERESDLDESEEEEEEEEEDEESSGEVQVLCHQMITWLEDAVCLSQFPHCFCPP